MDQIASSFRKLFWFTQDKYAKTIWSIFMGDVSKETLSILSNHKFFILSVNWWYTYTVPITEAYSLIAIKTIFQTCMSLSIIFCYLLNHWYDRNYHYHSSSSLCYRGRKSLLMYMSAKSNFPLQKLYLDENVVSINSINISFCLIIWYKKHMSSKRCLSCQ